MADQATAKIGKKGFSQIYEQLCNFLAVSRVSEPNETIKGLISLCLIEMSDDSFSNAQDFHDVINILFDISIPGHQIQIAIDQMIDEEKLLQPTTNYIIDPGYGQTLRDSIQKIEQLEKSVKAQWLEEVRPSFQGFPSDELWRSLKKYLYSAFRRHGIQAAALLDPSIKTPHQHEASLSSLLNEAVPGKFDENVRSQIRKAVSGFLVSAGAYGQRSQYITQLADGAFNYYTLVVPPEVVENIRLHLPDLLLLMDTNFLFGILDLDYNSQVEISNDIIRTVRERGLPFKLRYHEATRRELINTIIGIGYNLRARKWSRSLSRAAVQSENLNRLELKYHEKNASQPLDPDEFLKPYRHVDTLLKNKGIDIFQPQEARLEERNNLFHQYKEFLENIGKEYKTDDVIHHDVTVLDAVRHLRNHNLAAIEGGSLLLSRDYTLYRFDWESSRVDDNQPCVVLPNMFWQILRPLIPADPHFEKSFASTFALPEFRAIGSGASRACSKMLGILASWEEIPEETALRLLSSEILLDQLKTVTDDQEFEKQVKQAFIEENAMLLEEKMSLENQIKQEKTKRKNDLARQQKLEGEINALERKAEHKKKASEGSINKLESSLDEATTALKKEKERSETAIVEKEKSKIHTFRMALVAGLSTGLVIAALFLGIVHLIPWKWFLQHPNSIPLQIGSALISILGSIGLFVPKWRKYAWGSTGVAGLIFILLSLLGDDQQPIE